MIYLTPNTLRLKFKLLAMRLTLCVSNSPSPQVIEREGRGEVVSPWSYYPSHNFSSTVRERNSKMAGSLSLENWLFWAVENVLSKWRSE